MRYWHPFSEEAARAVRDWDATEVLLLPLYPQFSTTTTGSSMAAWDEAARAVGLRLPTTTLCCWHSDEGFAAATAALVREARDKALAELPPGTGLRVLFSAHGLPESIVKRGDPYQWQVERTVAAVVDALGVSELDHQVCYQSRVTPQRWIGPSLEEALEKAAEDGVAALVCPIAFVSEHSETLVELDVEYREVAHKFGVPGYFRVPTQNSDAAFIASVAALARRGAEERTGAVLLRRCAAVPARPRRLPARQGGRRGRQRTGARRQGAGQGPRGGVTAPRGRARRPCCSTATACWPTARGW
jgi:ferrochelatase